MSAAAALGAEDEVGSQQPEPLTASALARLEKHNGNHPNVPKPAAQKHVEMDLISHRASKGTRYAKHPDMQTLERLASHSASADGLFPRAKLERRKDIVLAKRALAQQQKKVDRKLARMKQKLAEAEAKEAAGQGASVQGVDNKERATR